MHSQAELGNEGRFSSAALLAMTCEVESLLPSGRLDTVGEIPAFAGKIALAGRATNNNCFDCYVFWAKRDCHVATLLAMTGGLVSLLQLFIFLGETPFSRRA